MTTIESRGRWCSWARCWALAALAATLPLSAVAEECPAGQRRMTFPAEGHFEYWRYSTPAGNLTKEEWWFSESRQKRRERLPSAEDIIDQYFDFAEQTVTLVQHGPGGELVRCLQFPTSDSFSRPTVGEACYEFVEAAIAGGLTPVERWIVRSGTLVAQDVTAERIGEELIPFRLYDRQSATLYTAYMNFRARVDEDELTLPCTPTAVPGSAVEVLRDLERQHGLPPGTLTGSRGGR